MCQIEHIFLLKIVIKDWIKIYGILTVLNRGSTSYYIYVPKTCDLFLHKR
jgi:hypothetical protein